jgi:hypothetical protein
VDPQRHLSGVLFGRLLVVVRNHRADAEHGPGDDDQRGTAREHSRGELSLLARLPRTPVKSTDELRALLALPFTFARVAHLLSSI